MITNYVTHRIADNELGWTTHCGHPAVSLDKNTDDHGICLTCRCHVLRTDRTIANARRAIGETP